jgi:quercetin dioxygenase-like cupin family protein
LERVTPRGIERFLERNPDLSLLRMLAKEFWERLGWAERDDRSALTRDVRKARGSLKKLDVGGDPVNRRQALGAMLLIGAEGPLSTAFAVATTRNSQEIEPAKNEKKVKTLFERDLPELPGEGLEVTLVEVDYGVDGSSIPHKHPGAVFGYVLQGSIQIQVEGEPLVTYSAGDVFYEPAGRKHIVGRNAKPDQVAKLLAFHIGKKGDPLTIPAKDG